MHLFPVFLHLESRRCLVVGGGAVGLARAEALRAAHAEVLVVDPSPSRELQRLVAGGLRVEARGFEPADCMGMTLVFACSDRADVNAEVVEAARSAGALVSRADDAGAGDFANAATLRRGDLCVAVSSGGSSPDLAVRVRDRVADTVGEEYGEAAALLAELRGRTEKGAARRRSLAALLDGGLVELLREGRRGEARALVDRAIEDIAQTGSKRGVKEESCTR